MKKPENYNAGATIKKGKIDLSQAISNNFSSSQREPARPQQTVAAPVTPAPVQTVTSTPVETPAAVATTPVQQPVVTQAVPVTNVQPVSQNTVQIVQEEKPEPKKDIKEKFLVSMSKGERSVFKAFCAMQNVSMNHFVMCAMDYFKEDLENGKVTISPHSYKRTGN